MAGKPRDHAADKALSLRLPQELHDRLAHAADGRSVSEEIRQRLDASFAADPKTGELLRAIGEMAGRVSGWREDPTQFAALARAINLILAGFMPAGEPKASNPALASVLVGSALQHLSPDVGQHIIEIDLSPEAADNLRRRFGVTREEKP